MPPGCRDKRTVGPARVDPDRLARVRTLAAGPHAGAEAGLCALEAVAYVAGEPHSDEPACASPSIAAFVEPGAIACRRMRAMP